MMIRILTLAAILMVSACSDDRSPGGSTDAGEAPDHVWKDQTQALEKAKQLEQQMGAAFEKRAGDIEAQSK